MTPTYDVIVAGVGGMGSAATAHLAARGLRVLALEQHELGHGFGSSHGLTRIIRLAYFEDPSYVPLLRRAFALWRELQDGLDEPLLHVTGGLDVGTAGSVVFEGSLRSCREHDLPHEVLDATALAARFPGWRPAANAMAVYQPDAGFLTPERCIQAYAHRAQSLGADIRSGERVLSYTSGGGRVRVRTDRPYGRRCPAISPRPTGRCGHRPSACSPIRPTSTSSSIARRMRRKCSWSPPAQDMGSSSAVWSARFAPISCSMGARRTTLGSSGSRASPTDCVSPRAQDSAVA